MGRPYPGSAPTYHQGEIKVDQFYWVLVFENDYFASIDARRTSLTDVRDRAIDLRAKNKKFRVIKGVDISLEELNLP